MGQRLYGDLPGLLIDQPTAVRELVRLVLARAGRSEKVWVPRLGEQGLPQTQALGVRHLVVALP